MGYKVIYVNKIGFGADMVRVHVFGFGGHHTILEPYLNGYSTHSTIPAPSSGKSGKTRFQMVSSVRGPSIFG